MAVNIPSLDEVGVQTDAVHRSSSAPLVLVVFLLFVLYLYDLYHNWVVQNCGTLYNFLSRRATAPILCYAAISYRNKFSRLSPVLLLELRATVM